MYKWEEDIIREIKKSIFELLLLTGETPVINNEDTKEKYIISGGIKFSKTSNNSKDIYEIEDTTTYDDYHIINNITILKLIKEYVKKLIINKKLKDKTKILIDDVISSTMSYENVEKEINLYENNNRKS